MPETAEPTLFPFPAKHAGYKTSLAAVLCGGTLILNMGCAAAPPVEEYAIARVALQAARAADGLRYAPSLWHRAEQSYQAGKKAFTEKDFSSAQKHFDQATVFAERAENAARLKRLDSGEFF